MSRTILLSALALFFLALLEASHATSFDCSKAKTRSETLICSDPELSRLEEEFTGLYKKAKLVAKDKEGFNRMNLAEWKWRETACVERQCLTDWFGRRNAQFKQDIGAQDSLPTRDEASKPAYTKIDFYDLQIDKARLFGKSIETEGFIHFSSDSGLLMATSNQYSNAIIVFLGDDVPRDDKKFALQKCSPTACKVVIRGVVLNDMVLVKQIFFH